MDTPRWTLLLTAKFPNLSSEGFEIVERPSKRYNCIAYAAGDAGNWWWPDGIN